MRTFTTDGSPSFLSCHLVKGKERIASYRRSLLSEDDDSRADIPRISLLQAIRVVLNALVIGIESTVGKTHLTHLYAVLQENPASISELYNKIYDRARKIPAKTAEWTKSVPLLAKMRAWTASKALSIGYLSTVMSSSSIPPPLETF